MSIRSNTACPAGMPRISDGRGLSKLDRPWIQQHKYQQFFYNHISSGNMYGARGIIARCVGFHGKRCDLWLILVLVCMIKCSGRQCAHVIILSAWKSAHISFHDIGSQGPMKGSLYLYPCPVWTCECPGTTRECFILQLEWRALQTSEWHFDSFPQKEWICFVKIAVLENLSEGNSQTVPLNAFVRISMPSVHVHYVYESKRWNTLRML